MLKEIVIKQIYRNETKKDGTKYIDRNGKPFKYVTIVVTDRNGADQKLSMCDYKDLTVLWKATDRVEVIIEKNGDFLNFRVLSKLDHLEARIAILEKKVPNPPLDPQTLAKPKENGQILDGSADSFQREVIETRPPELDTPEIDTNYPF